MSLLTTRVWARRGLVPDGRVVGGTKHARRFDPAAVERAIRLRGLRPDDRTEEDRHAGRPE